MFSVAKLIPLLIVATIILLVYFHIIELSMSKYVTGDVLNDKGSKYFAYYGMAAIFAGFFSGYLVKGGFCYVSDKTGEATRSVQNSFADIRRRILPQK